MANIKACLGCSKGVDANAKSCQWCGRTNPTVSPMRQIVVPWLIAMAAAGVIALAYLGLTQLSP